MAKPYKILVVDDEPDLEPLMLQRMRRHIRGGRYEFVFAGNGVEALQKLNEDETIDMVLSDINMPQMDGLTLLDQIPNVSPDIRAVIISAYGDMQNIRTAMNRGAFDFVTKPVDFEDLQVTIDRTLRHLDEWREAVQSRDKLVALENELDIASKIQQSILPGQFPTVQDFQIYANMEPAREVGGDFYDVIRLDRGQMGLAIADVSGKGVPAALFMMSSRTLLKGTAIGGGGPAEVVAQVNDLLYEQNEAAMFVTVLYAVYDPERAELTYSCAGHDPPLVVHPDGSSTSLPLTGGLALGVVPQFDFGENTVPVAPGDTVVLYTDGVTEAMNGKDEQFGLDRLRETYSSHPPADVKDAISTIFDAVSDFAGDTPQSDDVTCVALHRGGSAT